MIYHSPQVEASFMTNYPRYVPGFCTAKSRSITTGGATRWIPTCRIAAQIVAGTGMHNQSIVGTTTQNVPLSALAEINHGGVDNHVTKILIFLVIASGALPSSQIA